MADMTERGTTAAAPSLCSMRKGKWGPFGSPAKRLIIGQTGQAGRRADPESTPARAACAAHASRRALRASATPGPAGAGPVDQRKGSGSPTGATAVGEPGRGRQCRPERSVSIPYACARLASFGGRFSMSSVTPRARGALPGEQHRERRRIELRERAAVDGGGARLDAREPLGERGFRARVGQRGARVEAAHDACLPEASCWLRSVRNWISPSTPLCWIFSLNCCW